MKPVFICHQLKATAEDPLLAKKQFEANIESVRLICRSLFSSTLTPIGVHLHFPQFMDDNNPEERELGIKYNHILLQHYLLPLQGELWVYGPDEQVWKWHYAPRISEGMAGEIRLCQKLGIPVVC